MNRLQDLIQFLDKLEDKKIYYQLNKIRDSILVEVTVPGQKWEIEYMYDGTIEVEKFVSEGTINDEKEIDMLFEQFSD